MKIGETGLIVVEVAFTCKEYVSGANINTTYVQSNAIDDVS